MRKLIKEIQFILNLEQKKDLVSYYADEDESEQKVIAVKNIYTDLAIQQHTIDMMKAYHAISMKHLDAIDSNKKQPLLDFSKKIMARIS